MSGLAALGFAGGWCLKDRWVRLLSVPLVFKDTASALAPSRRNASQPLGPLSAQPARPGHRCLTDELRQAAEGPDAGLQEAAFCHGPGHCVPPCRRDTQPWQRAQQPAGICPARRALQPHSFSAGLFPQPPTRGWVRALPSRGRRAGSAQDPRGPRRAPNEQPGAPPPRRRRRAPRTGAPIGRGVVTS